MRQILALSVLVVAGLACSVPVSAERVTPPPGWTAIVLKEPVWLPGAKTESIPFSAEFPVPTKTDHFEVVNAGYWIANQQKLSQVFYEFTLKVAKPFAQRVYTRVLLSNPEDSATPIKYEQHMDPAAKSQKAIHGPLKNVKTGQKYTLVYEAYSDEARSVLLERVSQEIVAPFDSTSGCVELSDPVKNTLFPKLRSAVGGIGGATVEKTTLACEK